MHHLQRSGAVSSDIGVGIGTGLPWLEIHLFSRGNNRRFRVHRVLCSILSVPLRLSRLALIFGMICMVCAVTRVILGWKRLA